MRTELFIPSVPQRKWNLLWRCKEGHKWHQLWDAQHADKTQTATEYAMCLFMWLRGFREGEIVAVISAWWRKHGLSGNFYHLRHFVIPQSYLFAQPYLAETEARYRETRRREQASRRARRRQEAGVQRKEEQVLSLASTLPSVKARLVADQLSISAAAARKLLSRLTQAGKLVRVAPGLYSHPHRGELACSHA